MKRRQFIRCLSVAPVLMSLSALSGSLLGCSEEGPVINTLLLQQLSSLYNPKFVHFSQYSKVQQTAEKLNQRGVVPFGGSINFEKLRELAPSDDMVEFNGDFYTESEFLLYGYATQVINAIEWAQEQKQEPYYEPVELLPGVDFTAGDLRDFRSRSGVKACIDACETEPSCSAFTFAKYSHPDPLKRNMCWLKGEGFQYTFRGKTEYISGIKPQGG